MRGICVGPFGNGRSRTSAGDPEAEDITTAQTLTQYAYSAMRAGDIGAAAGDRDPHRPARQVAAGLADAWPAGARVDSRPARRVSK